jgi:hypothetical protein
MRCYPFQHFPEWHAQSARVSAVFADAGAVTQVPEYRRHGFLQGLLAGRSAQLVVTMRMPALIY